MIKGYKFLVNEEEKSRILNLHKNRTSSQYLILEYKEELTLPQTEPKIEFQKPTDHKTALDQIKKELNVQQGDNISDAVLKFLKDNTPKN